MIQAVLVEIYLCGSRFTNLDSLYIPNIHSHAIQRCVFEKIRVAEKELGVNVVLQSRMSKFKRIDKNNYVDRYTYDYNIPPFGGILVAIPDPDLKHLNKVRILVYNNISHINYPFILLLK